MFMILPSTLGLILDSNRKEFSEKQCNISTVTCFTRVTDKWVVYMHSQPHGLHTHTRMCHLWTRLVGSSVIWLQSEPIVGHKRRGWDVISLWFSVMHQTQQVYVHVCDNCIASRKGTQVTLHLVFYTLCVWFLSRILKVYTYKEGSTSHLEGSVLMWTGVLQRLFERLWCLHDWK